jgi:hypothetical protein
MRRRVAASTACLRYARSSYVRYIERNPLREYLRAAGRLGARKPAATKVESLDRTRRYVLSVTVRLLAQTPAGTTVLVAVGSDRLPVGGGFDPSLYKPVRIYHADRDELTEPLWLGSAMKFLGGYLKEPRLDAEERVLARVIELAARSGSTGLRRQSGV